MVGCVCGKISHTKKAAELGADFVIVQGTEGGGHTGQLGNFIWFDLFYNIFHL